MEVFEKIKQEAKKRSKKMFVEKLGNKNYVYLRAIGTKELDKVIVEVAEEYNNGWIPCSSGKLPEDGVDVLVWFEYFRYGIDSGLFQTAGISYTYNGDWSGFVNGQSGWNQLSIIAWQPLPPKYQPKGD